MRIASLGIHPVAVLASPLIYESGCLRVPDVPGLGGAIDIKKLAELPFFT